MTKRVWGIHLILLGLVGTETAAQQIDDNNYLHYVPLEYPRLSRQTEASVRFQIFGDRSQPRYRDTAPIDGIDDARGEVLLGLAQRFAPFMVQNTFSVPMDHRKLMGRQPSFNLYVDTWDMAFGTRLIDRKTLNMNALGQARCPGDRGSPLPYAPNSADCRIVQLLNGFDPELPVTANTRTQALDVRSDEFQVLFFDFPGDNPNAWKMIYQHPVTNALRSEYHDAVKTYVHPFIDDVADENGNRLGYKFVIQYWFYYPLNDGGNNHEGDWEHIDVVVTHAAQSVVHLPTTKCTRSSRVEAIQTTVCRTNSS